MSETPHSPSLQEQYEQRRRERLIGLSMHMALTQIENLQEYVQLYSWPPGVEDKLDIIKRMLRDNYTDLKLIEKNLLGINNAFYAPIIPTEEGHKFTNPETQVKES